MTMKTHFGFTKVDPAEKTQRVAGVFHSVAKKYDLMNDLMSLGIHRWWKKCAIDLLRVRTGQTVLDLAGGTGDLSAKLNHLVGDQGKVVLSDINESMLAVGKKRLLDQGITGNIEIVQADAETLPFPDQHFDRIIIGFGLRNVTHKETALGEMYRVLKVGGCAMILEFSTPRLPGLSTLYDAYSFHVLPWLGEKLLKDPESYRYLAESIRMHPDQASLKAMMEETGFEQVDIHNFSGGIVAVHRGYKS